MSPIRPTGICRVFSKKYKIYLKFKWIYQKKPFVNFQQDKFYKGWYYLFVISKILGKKVKTPNLSKRVQLLLFFLYYKLFMYHL